MNIEALKIIVDSVRVDDEMRKRAKEILDEEKSDLWI